MMQRPALFHFLLLPLIATWLLADVSHAGNARRGIAVIVAADGSWKGIRGGMSKRLLAQIYRKQVVLDDKGVRLHPVNLPASHPLRTIFSQAVFRRSPLEMASYWNEQYFQGISPPHVVASQEAVMRFVANTPGAIGYVAACRVDKRVRVIYRLKVKKKLAGSLCQ